MFFSLVNRSVDDVVLQSKEFLSVNYLTMDTLNGLDYKIYNMVKCNHSCKYPFLFANLSEFFPVKFIIIALCCAGQKHAYNF